LEEIINERWKNRYNEIYGNMSHIMGKMSREEREFLMNQLNDSQREAYQKMADASEQMDIERRFINLKRNAIKRARKMCEHMYVKRLHEGILKGYEGDRLLNYIYFPHLRWDGEIIRFYSLLIRLQKHLCMYLAKAYDGMTTAEDTALIEQMEEITNKCFIFADDYKILENISPKSKSRILEMNKYLQDALCVLGITKLEMSQTVIGGIDNSDIEIIISWD